ncbi:MAG: hypothetical protein PVJ39_02490 [Gammaproteobacteria bacterium]
MLFGSIGIKGQTQQEAAQHENKLVRDFSVVQQQQRNESADASQYPSQWGRD